MKNNKNILLCAVLPDPWLNVGKFLEEEGYNIKYWIGWDNEGSQKLVNQELKSVVFHENSKAWRGFPFDKNHVCNNFLNSVPIRFWKQYKEELFIALKMFDRLDSTGHSFNFSEREDFLYNQATLWYNVILDYKIDYLIFSIIPHRGFDYIIYLLARFLNKRILLFKHSYLPETKLALEKIEGDPIKFLIPHQRKEYGGKIYNLFIEKCQKFQNPRNKNDIIPPYMIRQNKTNNLVIILKRFLWPFLLKNITKKSNSNLKHRKFNYNFDAPLNIQLAYKSSFGSYLQKRKLYNEYNRNVRSLNLSKNKHYILFALHYQPEETTVPSAGNFYNQFSLIKHIASSLPDNFQLIVKEHSTQFHPVFEGERGRYQFIYDNLADIKGVQLVDVKYPTSELIKYVDAVVTLTGTIGFEALLLGKPVIVFGNAWYSSFSGVISVFRNNDIYDNLDTVFNNLPVINNDTLFEEIKSFCDLMLPIYTYKGYENYGIMSKDENSRLLFLYIKEWLNRKS